MPVTTLLPSIANESPVPGGTPPQAEPDKERELFDIARAHPEQGRNEMAWSDTLAAVALAYAERMAREDFFSHVDPQGFGPNARIRQGGFKLPDWYGTEDDANNCESITAVYDTAQGAWDRWLISAHRVHTLGEDKFYREQSQVGIGFYFLDSSRYKNYWVFLSAPEEP